MAYNPKWNVFSRIIDGDTRIRVIDDVSDSRALIEIDATQVANFRSGGLQLATGATANEFSTDGTLGGASDTAIPTEQAVKTYVDAQIGGSADKIWEGDSYVEVVDDGTNAGYVTMVTDGVEVLNVSELEQTFGNTADTHISILDGTATVPVGSVEAFAIDEDGISVELGATVNEFSTDGTLADDSNTALPTEQAVKTYVDSQIGSQSHKIFEGDSYIQVIDDGTAQAYAEVVINGTQVQYWDDAASSIRLGKASAAGRVTLTDTQIEAYVGTEQKLTLTSTTARLGELNDCSFQIVDSGLTQTATLELGNTNMMFASATGQVYLGPSGDQLDIDFATHVTTLTANSVQVLNLAQDTQRFGVAADTYITMTQSTGALDMYSNGSQIVDFSDTSQVIGVSGDTQLNLNQSTDTFTLSAGANTQVSGGLTSLTLGVAGDTTIALDQTTDQIAITAGGQSQLLIETDGVSVYEDLTVTGNLYVDGTTWVVHNQEVTTSDNMIVINYGEVGPGVTAGFAGLEIDRGTLTDYRFIFDEATDTFRVGEIGALQPVATREDAPENITVPWWNNTEKRFETQGNTAITIDTTAEIVAFYASSAQVGTFESDGLTLALGTNINEFSIDGTLSGDSDNAVPTEAAVKAYVDAQIGGSSNWIFQGDSFVRVIDDTTAAGYIEVVADGVQVQYWDAEAASIRMGKASGAGRVVVTDTSIVNYIGSDDRLNITATNQRLGQDGATEVTTNTAAARVDIYAGSNLMGYFTNDVGRIGLNTDTYIQTANTAGTVTMVSNSVTVGNLGETSQTLGVTGDSRIEISQSADTVDLYAGATQIFAGGLTTQVVGVSTDTNIALNQTADTIVLEAANATVATFGTTGLTMATGTAINEFSIDGTLADDSDNALPTEKAVKTYVDTAIANLNPDKIWEGDSYVEVVDDGTAVGYVSIVTDGVEVAHFDPAASTQRIGKASGAGRILVADNGVGAYVATAEVLELGADTQQLGIVNDTRVFLTQSTDSIILQAANATEVTVNTSGFALKTGSAVNEISTDGSFTADSDTVLITQKAAKTYIDTEITELRNQLDLINVQYVYSDTTAVSGDVLLVDTTAGDVNIELVEADDSKVVIKKVTGDSNNVIVSTTPGTIDGKASVTIDTKYQAYHFVSDSINFFIL